MYGVKYTNVVKLLINRCMQHANKSMEGRSFQYDILAQIMKVI